MKKIRKRDYNKAAKHTNKEQKRIVDEYELVLRYGKKPKHTPKQDEELLTKRIWFTIGIGVVLLTLFWNNAIHLLFKIAQAYSGWVN